MELETRIRAIVAQALQTKPDEIHPDRRFKEDLGADSLDVLVLVQDIEDAFRIAIPDEAVPALRTVRDAIEFVRGTVGRRLTAGS
jgi:acyl carrier protein